jgi:hypothetical protein
MFAHWKAPLLTLSFLKIRLLSPILIALEDRVCCRGCSTCPDNSASLRLSCPECVSSRLATSTAVRCFRQSHRSLPHRYSHLRIALLRPILWPCSKFQAPASATHIFFATITAASCVTRELPQIISFWQAHRAVFDKLGL